MADPIFKLPPDVQITPTSVPLSELIDWSLRFAGVPDQWVRTKGTGVKVAILDTGCDIHHPDLKDAIGGAEDFTRSAVRWDDRHNHGTHIAGIIGARANDVGVVGVAPECEMFIGKVLGDNGSGTDASILAGIEWAARMGCQFINMSLGGRGMSMRVRSALQQFASSLGRFPFAAAGNDGQTLNDPAAWPETIAVGAVDQDGRLTRFTSRDSRLDILGPGVAMTSTIPRGRYGEMTGTSMASPFVCAVGMLAFAKHRDQGQGRTPLLSLEDMRLALKATAKPTPDGFGLVQPGPLLDSMRTKDQLAPAADWRTEIVRGLASMVGLKVVSPAAGGEALGVGP